MDFSGTSILKSTGRRYSSLAQVGFIPNFLNQASPPEVKALSLCIPVTIVLGLHETNASKSSASQDKAQKETQTACPDFLWESHDKD